MSNGFQSCFPRQQESLYTNSCVAQELYKKLLAGSSPFPLSRAYPAPHLNQASPLVTNTAGDYSYLDLQLLVR